MFTNPLSFNGRIGRLEYLISFLIFWLLAIGINVIATYENSNILSLIKLIISYFFVAQGAKRCHDFGRSGWFQLIPLYFVWMLFAKGRNDFNRYNTINEDYSESRNSNLSNPIANLLFGVLGIALISLALFVMFGFLKTENELTLIIGGLILGGVFLASSIRNNNIRMNVDKPNQSFKETTLVEPTENREDEKIETIKIKGLTASQLIDKYKSNIHE